MTEQVPQNILAIIPARGGSKGIPGKNLRLLAGKPLLVHTIEQALAASISRVIVSTDAADIARVAGEAGAEVVIRPPELSGDTASSESALLHVLDTLAETQGYTADLVVFLQCTSPLRQAGDIDRAVQTLLAAGADSLLSLAPFAHFLWWQPEGQPLQSYNFDYHHRPRHQELPRQYMENGSIYVFKPWVLRETGNRLGGKFVHYEMHPLTALDIDTPADLLLCEAIMTSVWPDLAAGRSMHS